jgi:hypothetical protein
MNLFCIPNSPIKERPYSIPTFDGYGTRGALSRFVVSIPGIRDIQKQHPSRFGNRKGANIIDRNRMDISAKFIGNFLIKGLITDANATPIAGCIMKLFRGNDDQFISSTLTDNSGVFIFFLPNDSYKSYYMTSTRTDMTHTAGITSYLITPVQV